MSPWSSWMLLRHARELPEVPLQSLGQRLEALGKADRDGLDVRVGQHQVVDQVREGDAAQADAQVVHMGEVGLRKLARRAHLLRVALLLRAVQRGPLLDMALEGPQLDRLVAAGLLGAEEVEERLGLQGGIALQLADNPGPVVGEGIRARTMRPGTLELTGEGRPPARTCGRCARSSPPARPLVPGCGLFGVRATRGVPRHLSSWRPPPFKRTHAMLRLPLARHLGARSQAAATGNSCCRHRQFKLSSCQILS